MQIALFLPNWVGDTVMATPAIHAVREKFPKAHVVGVGRPYLRDLLDGSPWINEFVDFDKHGPRPQRPVAVWRHFRQRMIDIALLFPNSFRAALVARLAGCRRRIGYARYGRSLLLTDRLLPIRDQQGMISPSPILHAYNRIAE